MSFFDKLKKSKGGYIFLSHSHDDIDKVRMIRNSLEEEGFEPLCFYLKCLNDDSEIEELIKREIDAREWFVFVDSENSRKSKWVTLEREYIRKTNNKKIITVDIEDDDAVSKTIQRITHNLRLFISYSARDRQIAERIKNKLEEKDYLVFFPPDSIPAGSLFDQTITNAIYEASQDGGVIALLTPNSVKSEYFLREIEYAFSQNGIIIPILIGDVELSFGLKFYLNRNQFYCLPENPSDDEIDKMIDKIGCRIIDK